MLRRLPARREREICCMWVSEIPLILSTTFRFPANSISLIENPRHGWSVEWERCVSMKALTCLMTIG
jgi:hypothetical protein